MPDATATVEAATETPKPKRRGRPPGRKRKDPEEAPIDGDYSLDQVTGKRPGYECAWVVDEDLPRMRARGYVDVERQGNDGPRPVYDMESDERLYRVGASRLRLMEITSERKRRVEAGPLAMAAARVAPINVLKGRRDDGSIAQQQDGVTVGGSLSKFEQQIIT